MQVFAKAHSDHEEIGEIQTAPIPQQERIKMIVIRSGAFFMLALASVFIPMLHFILVPAFLIASVVAGLSSSRYTSKVISGSVHCPHCKAAVSVQPMPISWPLICVCQSCASSVRLYQASQKA